METLKSQASRLESEELTEQLRMDSMENGTSLGYSTIASLPELCTDHFLGSKGYGCQKGFGGTAAREACHVET